MKAILLSALFVTNAYAVGERHGPNVVVILMDDLGYGELGCYGHPRFKTPRIDQLAREGARLTSFYVGSVSCAPSRATLLTGRYAWRHGVMRNPTPDRGVNHVGIAADELTVAEALSNVGYATACFGKWHLGHRPRFYPSRHGFDEFFGILYSNDMRPIKLIDGQQVVEYPVVQALLTKKLTERALRFIDENRNWPFLLYLAQIMPHYPLAVSEEFYGKSGAGLYGDVIAELDWSVGQVLDRIEHLGLAENTLVILTSDNGPWFGGSTGGLRGMKVRAWEGGVRVPMIARWPGVIPKGQVLGAPCGTIDILPTVLSACNVDLPADRTLDGRNILPVLTRGAPSPHEALFAMVGRRLHTVRSGRWKLHVLSPGPERAKPLDWVDDRAPDGVTILAPFEQYPPSAFPGVEGGDPPQTMMLFDLDSDPAEQHNVAEQHPEVVRRLKAHFDRARAMIE